MHLPKLTMAGDILGYCAIICATDKTRAAMEANGFKLIDLAVSGAKSGGVEEAFVVFGENVSGATCAYSFEEALKKAGKFDGAFIIDRTLPLAIPKTYAALEKAAKTAPAEAFVPSYGGVWGWPVLVKSAALEKINFSGEMDFSELEKVLIPVEDPGIIPHGDDQLEKFKTQINRRFGMAEHLREKLYEEAELLPHIRAHCRAVGELSARMAQELIKHGFRLDVELCRTAGALHDILRLEEMHPLKGARFLRDRGYWAVSHIIAAHNDFEGIDEPDFDESNIVCLADKLLQDDRRVSFEVRYKKVRDIFPEDTPLGVRIREDERKCRIMGEKYKKITGISLE